MFSIPAYYGRGVRWYGMARMTPLRRVDVWVRYGAWIYRDVDRISSGLQEVADAGAQMVVLNPAYTIVE